MPIIPATWEAEAQESLEPGRQRLQQAKITLCGRDQAGQETASLAQHAGLPAPQEQQQ